MGDRTDISDSGKLRKIEPRGRIWVKTETSATEEQRKIRTIIMHIVRKCEILDPWKPIYRDIAIPHISIFMGEKAGEFKFAPRKTTRNKLRGVWGARASVLYKLNATTSKP